MKRWLDSLAYWWLGYRKRPPKRWNGKMFVDVAGCSPTRIGPQGRIGHYFALDCCYMGWGDNWCTMVLRDKSPEDVLKKAVNFHKEVTLGRKRETPQVFVGSGA